jgi:anti-sigma-K factor RskA
VAGRPYGARVTPSGPLPLDRLDEIEIPTDREAELPAAYAWRWLLVVSGVMAAALLAAALFYATRPAELPSHTTVHEVESPYAHPRR